MDSKQRSYVVLEGDLDFTKKTEIARALPDPAAVEGVVINLMRATYVDSMVLGMLIQFRRRFIEAGGNPNDVVLVLPKEGPVHRMFETTGLVRVFPVADAETQNVQP